MSSEAERLKELDHLIRTTHAELGALQLHLITAHQRQVNPAQLGVHIANLGRQLSVWKHERRFLCRYIAERSRPICEVTLPASPKPEAPKTRRVARTRRATPKKSAPAA